MQQGNACVHLQSFMREAKIHIFADTLWGCLLPREDRSRRDQKAVISVAFSKADCEVQVPLLSEMVFQPQSPLPLKNGNVTLAC